MLHKQHGDYNTKTSIFLGQINPFCTEDDIVEELNIILKEHRMKKAAANPEEDKQNDVNAQKNFILGCIVFYDQIKQRSKQFAFVDFNCPEAA